MKGGGVVRRRGGGCGLLGEQESRLDNVTGSKQGAENKGGNVVLGSARKHWMMGGKRKGRLLLYCCTMLQRLLRRSKTLELLLAHRHHMARQQGSLEAPEGQSSNCVACLMFGWVGGYSHK